MLVYTIRRGWAVGTDKGCIRRVRSDEIEQLSALIRNTLLISNSLDYDMRVIQNLSRVYSPTHVGNMALRREVYVYTDSKAIGGTVSLKGDTIFAFFIAPDRQRMGIGSKLLSFVEKRARASGVQVLKVGASATARKFYTSHGYGSVTQEGDSSYGDVFYMEKKLIDQNKPSHH